MQSEQESPLAGPSQARRVSIMPNDDLDLSDSREHQGGLHKALSEGSSETGATLTSGDDSFDLEKGLRQYMRKREEAGIKPRELGVLFENLHVVGLGAAASYQQTLWTFFNPMTIVDSIKTMRHPPVRDILNGFEGVVRPGEMLLVLGRPGSGCSTLLKTLANQRAEFHSVEGTILYDSLTSEQIANHFRGDVQYCPEDDIHFPTLTVGETLNFAAKTRAPKPRAVGQTRNAYIQLITDVYSTIFGLKHVEDVVVGDASLRGVSGGEKKRVSISEAMSTRGAITCWDNSTRGLDSSTALEFVRALRTATHICNKTSIVTIYQAGESLYELFDKVCLIYEGRMVYYGPADQARQYFMDMGYVPANRQTTADFLVSVTDPKGRSCTQNISVPHSALEFEAYYKNSTIRKSTLADMELYKDQMANNSEKATAFRESAVAEHAKHTRNTSPFTISIPMQMRAVIRRRVFIMKGNWLTPLVNMIALILQAIIVGTTFFNSPVATSAYFSRGGVIFFSLFIPILFNMAEIPALFAQRPIVLRHQKAAMYHPMIEALALTVVDIPITVIIMSVYTIILYFMVHLQRSAGQFFIFLLFAISISLTTKAFFRALAAAFGRPAPAQAVAGIMLFAISMYNGYQVPRPTMIGALKWISYINPLTYAFSGTLTNEFSTIFGTCSNIVPSGPGYEGISSQNQVCTTVGSVPGQSTVSGSRFVLLSYGYTRATLWRDFGILVAFFIFFLSILLIFTEFNTALSGENSVIQFKRGSKSAIIKDASAEVSNGGDKEKGDAKQVPTGKVESETSDSDSDMLARQTKMTNTFSWRGISYVVPVGGGEHRQLLDDVSGCVVPGKLTALMGESGAGKTTLLNVLAERVDTGVVRGDRYINGQALPPDFQAQTGYCAQTDTHVPTNTVREALQFSARLRQPQSVPTAEKDAYAELCLKMCGLEAFADAVVGSLGVEHRKRTTIGVELAAKPQLLLFLDEPTSGLDSQSAWAIISFLRYLADNGQAILCTIHQPSAELFQVFDRLLLLRKGGQTVYFGDLGHNATTLIKYFEDGGSRECKPGENPAEFMLDVIGAGATAHADRDWHEIWLNSKLSTDLNDTIEELHEAGRHRPPVSATFQSHFASSWGNQTRELIMRQFQYFWREPTYLMSKLTLNIIGGLFIGFTFFKSSNSIQGTQNKLFSVFMATIMSAPLGNQIHVPYVSMRDIYEIRERSSRMYHWSALVTAQILVEIPWNILGSSLFFLCWYWTVGFESSRGGYTYLMYGVLFPLYYTTVALAMGAMSPTAEIAGILFSFLFSFVLTFDGVAQPYAQLGWWKWMYRLSPFTYLIEGIMGETLANQEINCASKELATLQPPSGQSCGSYMTTFIQNAGGYLTNPDATSDCQFCSSRTTEQFLLPIFNIRASHHWRNVGIFCAYILFNTAAVYALTYIFRIWSGNPLVIVKELFTRKKTQSSGSGKSSPDEGSLTRAGSPEVPGDANADSKV